MDAVDDRSSTKGNTSDDTITSSSRSEETTALSEHSPVSSEAAESKTAADDVMVQIRARKSEVCLRSVSRSVSCSGSDIFEPSLLSVKQMNNHK